MNKFFRNLFYFQFLLINILITALVIRGLVFVLSHQHHRHFDPEKWYLPLVASTATSAVAGLAWQLFTRWKPARSVKAVFWVSPLLTCGAGVVLVAIGTGGSLAAGVMAVVFSVVQSLYACWVSRRFDYATRVVAASVAPTPAGTALLVVLSIFSSFVYSCFIVAGIGGATASGAGTLDTIFILAILVSLTWTMHVIKNVLLVAMSRVKHLQFTNGANLNLISAAGDTFRHVMGSVCLGSLIVPVVGIIRGSARAVNLVGGDTDEFLFSCASCYSGVASRFVLYGNRWGFVQVGAYNKWFLQASMDTWESFKTAGMETLIDSDLTSSFCFLSGVAGGALSTLVGGSWALVIQKDYATEISLYSFLIGYLTCRIAMVWPQASVSAHYVAYAENPLGNHFDSTVSGRIQELQRSQV
uniref:Choline transporter-like protein n=1 Tax=Kalanchoe fedtschenkoi TaxID=63787 RepID=A0A7N0UUM8_KALFE